MVKQLRQVAGVASVKLIDFKRGLFAVTSQPGVQLSEGSLLAAARRSGFQPDHVVPPNSSTEPPSSTPPPTNAGDELSELTVARAAFLEANYERALKLAREVSDKPQANLETADDKRNVRSAEIQQFLSLTHFALRKYDDASIAARTALRDGVNWKWKTLRRHYAKTDDYSTQLRALENSIRNESTPAKRFLIAYHYLMLGQPKAARTQFEHVAKAEPDDKLVARLLRDFKP